MTTAERVGHRAGLRTIEIGDPGAALVVIVLHGRMMEAADLAPFAHSLNVPALVIFPDAPLPASPRGRTWWPVDDHPQARLEIADRGARDLHAMDPPGRAAARATLQLLIAELHQQASPTTGPRRVALVGFSQGGMLAMDYVLHAEPRPDALALLSSTRIALADWLPRLSKLAGLSVLVSHGRADAELAFSAGEQLRDLAVAGGAQVAWIPFEGTHEIPLVVWRALRRFLRAL